jgi:murein DD-endopeptidase MepM/ murein hydrolase activator NlpD
LHRRTQRGWIAAFVLCTLVVSIGTSTAGPKSKLHRTQHRLRALRSELERNTRRADSLKQRIDELNRSITAVQITINEIARVRAAVSESQAEVRRLREEIDAIKAVAIEQAVLLYKAGGTDVLDALLDARSITELNDRIEMLGIAAQQNTGTLVRYGRLRVAIRSEFSTLFARKAELERSLRAQARVLRTQAQLRKQLSEGLATLNRRIGRARTREGHLEHDAALLERKIIAAQARSAVEALGTSRQGFIWPLNGPVTSGYGPRWGGIHTGIDIDGYTGQPVVAAKAGTVIYIGAGMSGYGDLASLKPTRFAAAPHALSSKPRARPA